MKIKWNVPGFEEVRRSQEVQAEITRLGQAVAAEAGDGFEVDFQQGKSRFRGNVYTATMRAIRKNARENTLVSALERLAK